MGNRNGDRGDRRIHMRTSPDEVTLFKEGSQKGKKKFGVMGLLALIYAGVFFCSVLFVVDGHVTTIDIEMQSGPAAYLFKIWRQNLEGFYAMLVSGGTDGWAMFMQVIKYLCVGLVGAGMASAGSLLQGTFRNVLASPTTMGVQSGGTLGNMVYVLLFCSAGAETYVYSYDELQKMAASLTFWDRNAQYVLVLGGCVAGVVLILSIATAAGRGKVSSSALILSGTVFSGIIGSFSSLIQYYIILSNPNDERISIMRALAMGSFDGVYSLRQLLPMAGIILPCIFIMGLSAGRMNVLTFGEEPARTMGLNPRVCRAILIGFSTLITATVMAYVGHIGMIGFMVPQFMRKIVGPDFRRLFPATVIGGALFLTVIYDVARWWFMTNSLNVFTSGIGSVVMLVVLLKKIQKGGVRRVAQQ